MFGNYKEQDGARCSTRFYVLILSPDTSAGYDRTSLLRPPGGHSHVDRHPTSLSGDEDSTAAVTMEANHETLAFCPTDQSCKPSLDSSNDGSLRMDDQLTMPAMDWRPAPSSKAWSPKKLYSSKIDSSSDDDRDGTPTSSSDDRNPPVGVEPSPAVTRHETAHVVGIDFEQLADDRFRTLNEPPDVQTANADAGSDDDMDRQVKMRRAADVVNDGEDRQQKRSASPLDLVQTNGERVAAATVLPQLAAQMLPAISPSFQMSPPRHRTEVAEPSVVRRLESFVATMGNRRQRQNILQQQHQQQQPSPFSQSSSNFFWNNHRDFSTSGDVRSRPRSGTATAADGDDEEIRNGCASNVSDGNLNGATLSSSTSINGQCRGATVPLPTGGTSGRARTTDAPLDLSLRSRPPLKSNDPSSSLVASVRVPGDNAGSAAVSSASASSLADIYSTAVDSFTRSLRRPGDSSTEADGGSDSLSKLQKTFGENSRILDRVGYAGAGNAAGRRDGIIQMPSSLVAQSNAVISGFGALGAVSSMAALQPSPVVAGTVAGLYDTALRDLTTTAFVGGGNNHQTGTGNRSSSSRRHQAHGTSSGSAVMQQQPPQPDQTSSGLDRRRLSLATTTGGDYSNSEFPGVGNGGTEQPTSADGGVAADGSKPTAAGVRRLVRGQDAWMNGTGQLERRSSVLRCLECGLSFWSLPELTLHMIRTAHYANIIRAPAAGPTTGAVPPSSTTTGMSSAAAVTSASAIQPDMSSPSMSAVDDDHNNNNIDDAASNFDSDGDADASSAESDTDDVGKPGDDDDAVDGLSRMTPLIGRDDTNSDRQLWRRRHKRKRHHSPINSTSSQRRHRHHSRDASRPKIQRMEDSINGSSRDNDRSPSAPTKSSFDSSFADRYPLHPSLSARDFKIPTDRDGSEVDRHFRHDHRDDKRHHHQRQATGRASHSSSSTSPPSTPSPENRLDSRFDSSPPAAAAHGRGVPAIRTAGVRPAMPGDASNKVDRYRQHRRPEDDTSCRWRVDIVGFVSHAKFHRTKFGRDGSRRRRVDGHRHRGQVERGGRSADGSNSRQDATATNDDCRTRRNAAVARKSAIIVVIPERSTFRCRRSAVAARLPSVGRRSVGSGTGPVLLVAFLSRLPYCHQPPVWRLPTGCCSSAAAAHRGLSRLAHLSRWWPAASCRHSADLADVRGCCRRSSAAFGVDRCF